MEAPRHGLRLEPVTGPAVSETWLRVAIHVYLLACLPLAAFLAHLAPWNSNAVLHPALEATASIMALAVGCVALARYLVGRRSAPCLLLAVAFLGAAALDGYNAIAASPLAQAVLPPVLASLDAWSPTASRLFIALVLWAGGIAPDSGGEHRESGEGDAGGFTSAIAQLAMGTFLAAVAVPLLETYQAEALVRRPQELLAALFFTLALLGHLRRGEGRWLEHWLVVSLALSLASQAAFLAFAREPYDALSLGGHLLKLLSYCAVLVALLAYRQQHPPICSPYRVPGWTTLPGLSMKGEPPRPPDRPSQPVTEESRLLVEIGRIFNSSLDIDQVFQRFASKVKELIPCDHVMLCRLDPVSQRLQVTHVAGVDVPGRRAGDQVPLEATLTGESLRLRKPMLVQTETRDQLPREFPSLVPVFESGIRSFLVIPLISEDQVIGALNLGLSRPRSDPQRTLDLAESLGTLIVGSVVNSRLHDSLRRVAAERASLAEIGRIISSSPDIGQVYERFAEEVRRLIPSDRVVISIIDQQREMFVNSYVSGSRVDGRDQGASSPLSGTMTQEVVNRGAGIILQSREEVEEWARRLPGLQPVYQAGYYSMLSVPVTSSDQIVAVLHLATRDQHAYTERDLELAERIALQIGGAISNFKLRLQLQRVAQEKALLAEIGRAVASLQDFDELCQRIAEEVRQVIPFDRITISLADPRTGAVRNIYRQSLVVPDQEETHPGVEVVAREVIRTGSPLLLQSEDNAAPDLACCFCDGFHSLMSVPLVLKDKVIGTMALWSLRSYAYTSLDLALMENIATQVAGAIFNAQLYAERQMAEAALRQSFKLYRTLIETSPDAVVVTDLSSRVLMFNQQALSLFGYEKAEDALGALGMDIIVPEDRDRALADAQTTIATGSLKEAQYIMLKKDGSRFSAEVSTSLIRDAQGNPKAFLCVVRDVTRRKEAEAQIRASLREKDILLREIHHRVKNNMQVVSSLLDLQAASINDARVQQAFAELSMRVKCMALVQDLLYESANLARIDFSQYIENLKSLLLAAYPMDPQAVDFEVNVEGAQLDVDAAMYCGLIISELVMNSLRHAFPGKREGRVRVSLAPRDQDTFSLEVSDNGVGPGPDVDLMTASTLGLSLVRMLAKKLKATIGFDTSRGTTFRMVFPRPT